MALARALAIEPQACCCWTSPSARSTRGCAQELRRWLRRLHDQTGVTSVLVTHDQEEALEVADRVVVMNEGRVEQVGTPEEVYERPANPFVYDFLGHVNLFHGRVHLGRATAAGRDLDVPEYAAVDHRPATAYARPHELRLSPAAGAGPPGGEGGPLARISSVRVVGPVARLQLRPLEAGGAPLEAELDAADFRALGLDAGDAVRVTPQRLAHLPGRRRRRRRSGARRHRRHRCGARRHRALTPPAARGRRWSGAGRRGPARRSPSPRRRPACPRREPPQG